MNWKELNDYERLPIGTWLVKVNDKFNPYHVAVIESGGTMIIVGQYFHWDMEDLVAYTSFEECLEE